MYSPEQSVTSNAGTTLSILLLLAIAAALAIYLQNHLPEALPESAPATDFSAARALQQLRIISARPHPIGSQDHAKVRDHILRELSNLGLSPEIQKTIGVSPRGGVPFTAGTVQNVVARIKGTESGPAVLLACHYDSTANSFGANDDGAGVVALLETARALKASGPLKHDVILLFSDGEEVGLLGANAFTTHTWAKDVGLFLNFEARGNSGPVVMFETSRGNSGLIRQFHNASPRPVASSFFYEIYKLLPNDTDFTVFNSTGAQGLNFAYLNGIQHYHTQLDNVDEIDPKTLQHLGSNALALTRYFADNGVAPKGTNAIYFNVLGANFVQYSPVVNIILLLLTVLLFGFVVWKGFKTRHLNFFGIVWGFIALLFAIAISAVVIWFSWWLMLAMRPALRSVPWVEPYNSYLFRIAFVIRALAATSLVYLLLRRRADWRNLTVGALLWWLILSVAVTFVMPGGSYLFTLPLLFSLAGLAIVFSSRVQDATKSQFLLAVAMLPGVILWAPILYNVFVALTLNSAWLVIVCVVLLFGLMLAPIVNAVKLWRWWVPVVLLLASIVIGLLGISGAGFDKRHPKTNNLFYALSADTGKAYFASSDERTDEWTAQFLSNGMERGSMPEFFPGSPRAYWKSPASNAAQLAGPEASVTDDRTEGSVRTLSFRVTSPRQAPVLTIYAGADSEVMDVTVAGKRATRDSSPVRNWGMQYFALPPEGVEIVLKTQVGKPFKMLVVDRSYGLPDVGGSANRTRPEHMIPTPFGISDVTLVAKSFTF